MTRFVNLAKLLRELANELDHRYGKITVFEDHASIEFGLKTKDEDRSYRKQDTWSEIGPDDGLDLKTGNWKTVKAQSPTFTKRNARANSWRQSVS